MENMDIQLIQEDGTIWEVHFDEEWIEQLENEDEYRRSGYECY